MCLSCFVLQNVFHSGNTGLDQNESIACVDKTLDSSLRFKITSKFSLFIKLLRFLLLIRNAQEKFKSNLYIPSTMCVSHLFSGLSVTGWTRLSVKKVLPLIIILDFSLFYVIRLFAWLFAKIKILIFILLKL